jgi:RNA polymerase sigma factor (sigma-70 family)
MERDDRGNSCEQLLPLVTRIARGLWRAYQFGDYEEFYQDGCLGALRAIERYDASRGVPLEIYARPIIAGAIFNGIRARDPVSENARRLLRSAERARSTMAAEGRDVPTLQEMSQQIAGLAGALLVAYRANAVSLDCPLPRGQRVPADHDSDPARIIEESERRRKLHAALSQLTDRQRSFIELRYFRNKTVSDVSRELGISLQRAYQLQERALTHMRGALSGL